MKSAVSCVGQSAQFRMKAAEDSRTPPKAFGAGAFSRVPLRPARFWSAAPWSLRHPDSVYRDCRFTSQCNATDNLNRPLE